MANSNCSVSSKLLAYIAHGIDLNEQIKSNYYNSLIFIGDEGQIYTPATNTYIGIGKTAYTNLAAYTLYINKRIDKLNEILASSIVSKIYAQYDDYDYLSSLKEYAYENSDNSDAKELIKNWTFSNADSVQEGRNNWGSKDYGTTYVTLKGIGDYNPETHMAYTTYMLNGHSYNVSAITNPYGSSGITVKLVEQKSADPTNAQPVRNVITIDDTLTWSYIASAYTYSLQFAKDWSTAEANRIYHNILGKSEETFVPLSYDFVSYAYIQANSTLGFKPGDEPSSFTDAAYGFLSNYLGEEVYVTVAFDDRAQAEAIKDNAWGSITVNELGQFVVLRKASDVFKVNDVIILQKTQTNLEKPVNYQYYVKHSEYNDTYNTNIADGIQTLKEVAYLLDVLTDGFGSVTYYKTLTNDEISALQKGNKAFTNAGASYNPVLNNDVFVVPAAQVKTVRQYVFTYYDEYKIVSSDNFAAYLDSYRMLYGDAKYAIIDFIYSNLSYYNSETTSGAAEYAYQSNTKGVLKDSSDVLIETATFATATEIVKNGSKQYYYLNTDTNKYIRIDDYNNVVAKESSFVYNIYTKNPDTQRNDKITAEYAVFVLNYISNSEFTDEYSNAVFEKRVAEIVEEMSGENLGIKMAYTIAGNQEQINNLQNRLSYVEDGDYTLRSIDTTSSTYITLSTLSDKKPIKVGEYSYNVGNTNIAVNLQFGATYTSYYTYDQQWVEYSYKDIIADSQNKTDVFGYGFKENSAGQYIKTAFGYKQGTVEELTAAGAARYDGLVTTTAYDICKVYDPNDEDAWANNSTIYYKLMCREKDADGNILHADLESEGIVHTAWVNTYVADTYTLIENSLISLKGQLTNQTKDLLGNLDYNAVAAPDEFISYTYQWNGLIGVNTRKLPADEIRTNSETWGEYNNSLHTHTFNKVTASELAGYLPSASAPGNLTYTENEKQIFYRSTEAYDYVKLPLELYKKDWKTYVESYLGISNGELADTANLYKFDEENNTYVTYTLLDSAATQISIELQDKYLSDNTTEKIQYEAGFTGYKYTGEPYTYTWRGDAKDGSKKNWTFTEWRSKPWISPAGVANASSPRFIQYYIKVYKYIEIPFSEINITNVSTSNTIYYANIHYSQTQHGVNVSYTASYILGTSDTSLSDLNIIESNNKRYTYVSLDTVVNPVTYTQYNSSTAKPSTITEAMITPGSGFTNAIDRQLSGDEYYNSEYQFLLAGVGGITTDKTNGTLVEVSTYTWITNETITVNEGTTEQGVIVPGTISTKTYGPLALYVRDCEDNNEAEPKEIKYLSAKATQRTAEYGGYGQTVMDVTAHITYLEDASSVNSGLADANDVRTFIENTFEWVDISASVTQEQADNNLMYGNDDVKYNSLNPVATKYTDATKIKYESLANNNVMDDEYDFIV